MIGFVLSICVSFIAGMIFMAMLTVASRADDEIAKIQDEARKHLGGKAV